MREFFFASMRLLALVTPAVVALIALLAALAFGIWQSTRHVIIGNSIEDAYWFFPAAAVVLAIQIIARFVVEFTEERAHTRKTNTIRTLGDLIGEGAKLRADFESSMPTPGNLKDSKVYRDFQGWEARVERSIKEYEPKLVPYFYDTSGTKELFDDQSPNAIRLRMESRLIRLRELISLIAVR